MGGEVWKPWGGWLAAFPLRPPRMDDQDARRANQDWRKTRCRGVGNESRLSSSVFVCLSVCLPELLASAV